MKIVVTSDTHGGHEALGCLSGDVLIHCGDVENIFAPDFGALEAIDHWFGYQDFERIFLVGGNHDRQLQERAASQSHPLRNAVYLEDCAVEFGGLTFYGAPWVPDLGGMAYYADDVALARAWAEIPSEIDVLITHTPPAGVLDRSSRGMALGCPHLARRLTQISPALHCFGHVHAAAGSVEIGGTTYVNASAVNSHYEIVNRPFVFELPDRAKRLGHVGYGG